MTRTFSSSFAWRDAINHDGPTALCLSRQDLPVLDGTAGNESVSRGAYTLLEVGPERDEPDVVLVATGGEVWVAVDAAKSLAAEDRRVRVVSMPCWEDFAEQGDDYQLEVLPPAAPTLAVEAAASFGWDRWADDSVSIDHFGASAPGGKALEEMGFTAANVAERARLLLAEIA